jgi:hypothetical protein
MSFQNENIGMMDEGYFVSKGVILSWLNDLLKVPPSHSAQSYKDRTARFRRSLLSAHRRYPPRKGSNDQGKLEGKE